MSVRTARHTDVPQLCGLLSDFYAEVPYEAPLINVEKTSKVLHALIGAYNEGNDDAFVRVMLNHGTVNGAVIAERLDDIWTDSKVVFEYFIFVQPQFRGSPMAGKLMLNFKHWAESQPALIRAQASSGIDDGSVSALYEKLGWGERGRIYGLEVA